MLMWSLYLVLLSCFDIRKRSVPIGLLAMGALVAALQLVLQGMQGEKELWEPIVGIVPGLFLFLMAGLTHKAGYADGIILLLLGMVWGYQTGVAVLGISLLLLAFVSIVLLLLHKVNRRTQLPYLPFVTAAFVWKQLIVYFH